jgi:uncharacterized protein (DUF2147 family)
MVRLLAAALLPFVGPRGTALATNLPDGIWTIENEVAVESYDCDGLLCARIVWLKTPRDAAGRPNRDVKNPDTALQQRVLCGLTVIKGLRPAGPDNWEGGSFYDPRSGRTYSLTMRFTPPNKLVGRVYVLLPLFGKTQTLFRVQQVPKEGRC